MSSLLPARLARATSSTSIYDRYTRRRPAVEVRRRHRPRLLTASASRGSLIRGTNGQSNGIVPWLQDARRLGRRGQPGRQAQGRGLRLPRAVARRHRGVPRAARQHRRRRPPHAQPQPRQLGPRPVHAAGRGGLARGRCSTPKSVPAPARPVRRRVRARPTSRPRPQGCYERQVPARELYARMMRTLAQTGNGWMTFKDASNRAVQPDRAARATSCTCRTCAPRSSRSPTTTRPRSATSARSTSARSSTARRRATFDFERLRAHRAHRGAATSTGSSTSTTTRSTQAAASNPRWRPVGLGRDGPAGRVLPAAPAVRLRPRRASCRTRIAEEIYFHALSALGRAGRAARRRTRRSPRPAPRRGELQFDLWGVDADATRRAGTRCARGSPSTACATRC